MPKGVFPRTKPPYNKGVTKYKTLIARINWRLLMGGPMTLSEVYHEFNGEIGYKKLQWVLSRARVSGMLDPALIKENRGLMKNKGGGRPPKFKVGDKVRIVPRNGRTPRWLRDKVRIDSPRKVVDIVKSERGCTYYLGSNRIGAGEYLLDHRFRSNELIPHVTKNVGRPRVKRAYNRKNGAVGTLVFTSDNGGTLVDVGTPPSISCVNSHKEGVLV